MEDAGRSNRGERGASALARGATAAGRSLLVTSSAQIGRWDEMRIQQLYGRFVTRWAIDVMELRRRGLDVPGGRPRARPARAGGKVRTRRIGMDA